MEQNHYKREQEMKQFLSNNTINKNSEIEQLQKEREFLKATIVHKNNEIE
jgi:hypothetical protein